MRCSARTLASFPALALLLALTAVHADTPPAVAAKPAAADPNQPAADASATVSVATPTPAPPFKRERPISTDLAATLAAGMPKFNPPPKPPPEEEDIDLRDVDKPRNKIPRLPRYVVTDKKPPVFRERDLYTNRGIGELARKRYLTPAYALLNGLYIPFFSQSPTEHALAMYAEDERLQNMSDLKDTSKTLNRADDGTGTYVKKLSDETYMRGFDYRYSSGSSAPGSKD